MAMALSRSEMEQQAVPATLRLGNTFSERTRPGAGTWPRVVALGLEGASLHCCWLKVYCWGGPQGEWTTPLLTVFLLLLSREEESQEESSCFRPPAVSPGLGDHRETDRGSIGYPASQPAAQPESGSELPGRVACCPHSRGL